MEHLVLQVRKDPRGLKDFKGPVVTLVSPDLLGQWDKLDLWVQLDLREQQEVQDLRARKDQSEHRGQVVLRVPLALLV